MIVDTQLQDPSHPAGRPRFLSSPPFLHLGALRARHRCRRRQGVTAEQGEDGGRGAALSAQPGMGYRLGSLLQLVGFRAAFFCVG